MAASFSRHASKAVVQIAAFQIPVNDLLQIRPPETVLPGEMVVIDMDKGFKMVRDAAVIIRIFQFCQFPLDMQNRYVL
jgi:hypothetical protein